MIRRTAAGCLALVVAGAVATSAAPSGPSVARSPSTVAAVVPDPGGAYVAPLPVVSVVRGFTPPVTRYGAGHLGVDLRARPGEAVRAAGPGVVSFAGAVGGRGVVVVVHPDGIRTEYEPVRSVVGAGASVRAGEVIGHVDGTHRGCPGTCLHWGARRGVTYLDPLSLLRALAPVRLLPWPGDG